MRTTRPNASPTQPRRGRIVVIAGVNGAGKSSVVGATIRELGGRYYNPDEETRSLIAENPSLSLAEANARAWEIGRRGLERAIAREEDYTFETTLGGRTIPAMLEEALDAGRAVTMRYIGLDSPERHLARVRARVDTGGHSIPEERIRERYTTSREHVIRLLPRLTDLIVYDNSAERDPARGKEPTLAPLLQTAQGRLLFVERRDKLPEWVHPIVAAAILSDRELR